MEGKWRGLGPGGTRGTIELLCRGGGGGGQIAALEIPSVGGYKAPNLPQRQKQSLGFYREDCRGFLDGHVAGITRTAARGVQVRWEECEQYARVFSGAQCARIYPGHRARAGFPGRFLPFCCINDIDRVPGSG